MFIDHSAGTPIEQFINTHFGIIIDHSVSIPVDHIDHSVSTPLSLPRSLPALHVF